MDKLGPTLVTEILKPEMPTQVPNVCFRFRSTAFNKPICRDEQTVGDILRCHDQSHFPTLTTLAARPISSHSCWFHLSR